MRVDVVTIFPDYLAPLGLSLLGRARAQGLLDVRVHDLRTWTTDRHRTVDDTPYGGGAGMLMRPEPWGRALDAVVGEGRARGDESAAVGEAGAEAAGGGAPPAVPRLLVPSPAGRPFTQADAHRLAGEPWLVFACGRYEGIDARVVEDAAERMPVEEVSLGDYVLNGGEVAVLAIVEAVARLLPGVVGNPDSVVEESHADGLLEAPGWTKPPVWRGRGVPEVLLSGHHGRVAAWRREQSLRRTARHRPDLLAGRPVGDLAPAERAVLAEEGWLVAGEGGDERLVAAPPPVAD